MLLAAIVAALSACATTQARVAQFERFAIAGVQFSEAVPPVLDESFEAAVTTSSLVLEETRPGLDEGGRLAAIEEADSLLSERLAILSDLKRHARVLRSYFVALQALAQTDAESTGLTDVTGGVMEALGEVSPRIAGASVGGMRVGDVLAPAVDIAVGQFQSSVLEAELRRNGSTIERELALQEAALEAVADAMRSDLGAQAAAQDRDRIHLPYARSGTLAPDWNGRRLESFRRRIRLTSVDATAQAAATLRSSFVALVEGRLGDALIGALVQDITEVVTFAESAISDP